jgi:hypothetical protein
MASQPISLCADTRCGGCIPALRPACWRANHVARDWIEMRPLSFRLGDSRGLGLRGDMRAAKSLFFALYGGGLRKRKENGRENWFWNMTHRSQYWRPINRTGVSRRVKSGATYPEGRVFKLHGRSVRWNSHLLRNLLLQRTEQGKTQTTKLCWKTLRDGPWAGLSAARK